MKETYEFKEGYLVIQDPELGIDINTSYAPRMIPSDFSELPEMVVKKDEKGMVLRAFFHVDGNFEGQYLLYYLDGTIESECYYQKGELYGPSRFFSESGVCLSESWYFEGKKEGKVTRRFLSGKVASIQRYKRGLLHGKQEFYYDNGAIKTMMDYKSGALDGEVILYWPSGLKKREVSFQRGLRSGFDRMWNTGGTLIDEGEYKNGDPIGLHRRFFEDGAPLEERRYDTPLKYDLKKWDINGKPHIEKNEENHED